jgi:hypothetical protein
MIPVSPHYSTPKFPKRQAGPPECKDHLAALQFRIRRPCVGRFHESVQCLLACFKFVMADTIGNLLCQPRKPLCTFQISNTGKDTLASNRCIVYLWTGTLR